MRLAYSIEGWSCDQPEQFLGWLKKEAEMENYKGTIDIIFVGNEYITEINESYLHHDGATDVIAFDLSDDDEPTLPLESDAKESDDFVDGEVYVNLERAAEQAIEYNVSLTEEVSRLSVHGVLHLTGWDDTSEEDKLAMTERENKALDHARSGNKALPWRIIPPSRHGGNN